MQELEEGNDCPKDGCEGRMESFSPSCSCHISPPCGSCEQGWLRCTECKFKYLPEYKWSETTRVRNVIYRPLNEYMFDLGDGKFLFDCHMDSSSGSTMVYRGKYKGAVVAEDIIKYWGDGTFGHRGPSLNNGTFTYVKITD